MKVLIADYGLNCWYGNAYDYEERFEFLRETGYDGFENLNANTDAEAIYNSALARKNGVSFATCGGNTPAECLRRTAALGMDYIWSAAKGDFETFCRQTNVQIETAKKYGVKVGLHNHLGSVVETWEQLTAFMDKCPESALILDTAHLAGAGGDPLEAVERYFDRIVMVHLKDYTLLDPANSRWYERLRFCELGGGEMGDTNLHVLEKLIQYGYKGWLAVEHDTHLRDPRIDLKISRDYIRRAGI